MREYIYISKRKVSVLDSQFRRVQAPGVNVTFPLPPGGIGLQFNPQVRDEEAELVKRTTKLITKMRRGKHIVPLEDRDELDVRTYYCDTSVWSHGLFSFAGDFSLDQGSGRVVSYLLWRQWNDAIILLAGSPENVLGERVVHDGVWAYGTSGTWESVLHFAQTALGADEPDLAEASGTSDRWSVDHLLPHDGPDGERLEGESDQHGGLSPELLTSPRAVALAVLCLKHLTRLQQGRIDTAFRITERLPVDNRMSPPDWVVETLGASRGYNERIRLFQRYRAVYIGTPLYVAAPLEAQG